MAVKRVGNQTVILQKPPIILESASIAGKKEGEGPLADYFDMILEDDLFGEKTWEKAESRLIREVLLKVIDKACLSYSDINYVISGDLLNQCIAASFGVRESQIPFFGVYGACSTMAESISLGSMIIDGGFADHIVCMTSSHFCSAEKQFRFPLEMGSQRPPTAQWTVTGAGAVLLSSDISGIGITKITTGYIADKGIKDANNMGAAMAPATAATIVAHFKDTGLQPDYYDMIITGDLGKFGGELCCSMVENEGYKIKDRYKDCGVLIYDLEKQDVACGGSGCGCSAVVLTSYLYQLLKEGFIKRILFVATGALLSTTSSQQGESILGIAHAVSVERIGI